MTTVYHYKSNLRDIFFNLFELHDLAQTTLANEKYDTLDEATIREVLGQFEKFCCNEMARSFAAADREGLKFDGEGNVSLPESLKASLASYYENQWNLLDLPKSLGGYNSPPSVIWSAFELLGGSNPSASFYIFGSFIARIIQQLGTPSQQARFCKPCVDNHWGGSMVLTEPEAGSDVGSARSRARHVEGDVWEIEGTKRFITNGDFDAAENILHLVLARPEGASHGTKGLSLFIVPKYWVNEDGSMGERNGAFVTKIEDKMGLHASATCEMTFGDKMPCRGLLMGEVHDGIRQMFHVIEHARMGVGIKSMATLSTAYLNALAYAKERVQGADLAKAADKTSPRVRIIEHPDVRRMLMLQKCFAEGMRALCLYTAVVQDEVEIQGGHGSEESRAADKRNDLLLPLVKGYCSEKAYELLATSLQVHGGSGYCRDYPIEQYIRDAKIDTLYEGTTHIQAQDLFFRKIARDMGETLQALMGDIRKTVESGAGGQALATERAALQRAFDDVSGIFQTMLGKLQESVYHVGFQGNRILASLAELVIGWLLVRQAAIAVDKVDGATGGDKAFYQGKIAATQFYCANVLPELTLRRKLIEAGDLSLLSVPEEAF